MVHRKAPSIFLGLIVLAGVGYLANAGMNPNADRKVPYTGYIEMNGAPAPSGDYEVNFGLYATDGDDDSCLTTDPTACGLWGESQTLTVSAGRFSAVLGDGTGDTLNDSIISTNRLHIGMAVKGPADLDFVLLGKHEIIPVPLASRAAAANNYKVVGTLTVGGTATITGNATLEGDASVNGDLWARNAFIGYVGHAGWAGFANENRATPSGYALIQNSAGDTIVNAEVGETLSFRQGNNNRLSMAANGNWTATGSMTASALSTSGNTQTGSLSVTNGLPIALSGNYSIAQSNGGAPESVTMVNSNRSACFLTAKTTHDTMGNESVSDCYITDNGSNWLLWVNTDVGGGDPDTTCWARCLSW